MRKLLKIFNFFVREAHAVVLLIFLKIIRDRTVISKNHKSTLYVFLTEQQSNWILGAIAREIKNNANYDVKIIFSLDEIDATGCVLFMHYETARSVILSNIRKFKHVNYIIWYTHPRYTEDLKSYSYRILFFLSEFILLSSRMMGDIVQKYYGICNIEFLEYGVDTKLFHYKARTKNSRPIIGISSNFYERKNPDLIHRIIEQNYNYEFIIVGDGWDSHEGLATCKNVTFKKLNYAGFPDFYQNLDCFLSCSKLEGGPIGLVEALASGVPAAVSRTGLAEDIICPGVNGHIFEVDACVDNVSRVIEKTLLIGSSIEISESVSNYTWSNFSLGIYETRRKYCESIYTY